MRGTKLYVRNIDDSITHEDLEELFSNYGEVTLVNMFQGRGFGFVEMSNQREAQRAKEALDFSDFRGRVLRVSEAQSRTPRYYRWY